MPVVEWRKFFGLFVVGLLLFVTGFYFGYRFWSLNSETVPSMDVAGVIDQPKDVDVVATEVEGVFWIRSGEPPVCPSTHPIKGKMTDSAPVYYTADNKQYTRVKPHMCFATEEFARDVAGHVKKY